MNLTMREITEDDSDLQTRVFQLGMDVQDRHAVPFAIPYALLIQIKEWARDPEISYMAIFDGQALVGALAFRKSDGLCLDNPVVDEGAAEIIAFSLKHIVSVSGGISRKYDYVRVDVG